MHSPDPKPTRRVLTPRRLLAACAIAGTCIAGTATAALANPSATHPSTPRTSGASKTAHPITLPLPGTVAGTHSSIAALAPKPGGQRVRPGFVAQPGAKPPAWSKTSVIPYKNTWTFTVEWALVAGDTLAEGGGNGGLFLYHKTGSNTWTKTASFFTPPGQRPGGGAQSFAHRGAIDYAGDEIAVGEHPTRVYTLANGKWSMTATLPEPADEAGADQNLAMSGDGHTIVTAGTLGSSYYLQTYRLTSAGKWRQLKTRTSTDESTVPVSSLSLTKNGNTLFANPYLNSAAVLQATLDPSSGAWKLVNSNLASGLVTNVAEGVSADASGNRIAVGQNIPPSSKNPDWTNGFAILDHADGKWTLEGTAAPQVAPTGNTPDVSIDAAGDSVSMLVQDRSPAAFDGYIYREVSGKWSAVGWLKNPHPSGWWNWSQLADISPDGKFAAVGDGVRQPDSADVYTSSQSARRISR